MVKPTDCRVPQIRFKGFDEDWAEATVSDFVLSLDAGVSVNSGDRAANSAEFGILKTSAVTNGVFEEDENKVVLTEREQSRLKESVSGGTIIISRMNTPALVGASAYVESNHANLFLPDRLWAAKPRDSTSMRFLASILGSEKGRDTLSKLAKGTSGSMKNITKPDVLAVSVMAPSPPEQAQIGEYFRELDSLIGLHQRKHDKLAALKKAMLQKMFPQAGATTLEIRFKGFEGDWVKKPLHYLVGRYDNLRIPVTARNRIPGITPYYGANGIQDYVQGYTHEGEFILVAEDGANDLKNYPIQHVSGKIWVNNHAHVLQGKDGLAETLFLKYAFSQINFEVFLVGGGRAKLNAETMMKMELCVPTDIAEQNKIGSYFRTLDELISKHAIQLHKLKQIKSACLQKMFL